MRLPTGSALSRLELGPGEELYVADADIANAFYKMALPVELRRYFAMRFAGAARGCDDGERAGSRGQADRVAPSGGPPDGLVARPRALSEGARVPGA